jgi:hypothetical protein
MNDPLEAAIEASEMPVYNTTRTTVAVVAAFTVYGAYASVRDGSAKVKQIVQNRKAKKALKIETDIPQQ